MASKRIITVFGATGVQGGSVVDIFLKDPKLSVDWKVRGVTRDTTKESSKALSARGVEVVAADVHDKKSVIAAMNGSHTVFAVTNYWDPSIMSKEKDIAIGRDMADAAKEANVQHYIWSSLKHVTKMTNGELSNVHHFDSKAEIEEYIRKLAIPATYFLPGFYMSNMSMMGMFSNKNPSGNWMLSMPIPDTAIAPMLASKEDTGKFIKAIVQNRGVLLGKQIFGATKYMTMSEILNTFKKTFPEVGAKAGYFQVPKDTYINMLTEMGMPAPLELYENMLLLNKPGYYGGESLHFSHKYVTDKLTTWEEFMRKNEPFASLK